MAANVRWLGVFDGQRREVGLQVRHWKDDAGFWYQMRVWYREPGCDRAGRVHAPQVFGNKAYRDIASATKSRAVKRRLRRRYSLWVDSPPRPGP